MTGTITDADGGTIDLDDGEDFDFATPGTYLTKYREGDQLRDIRFVTAPGEKGAGTQNFLHSTREFELEITYVAATDGDCVTAVSNDMTIASGVTAVVVGPVTYEACVLKGSPGEQSRGTARGNAYKIVRWKFVSGRPPGEQ